MDLQDREERVQRAAYYETLGFRVGWLFLLTAGVSFAFAVYWALEWSPKVLWPLALGNLLSLLGAEQLRFRDDKQRVLAEADMERSGVVQKLWRDTRRRYRRLAVTHAVSALFVVAYYGARLIRGMTLAGQGLSAVTLTSLLILLAAFAYWRSCR